MGGVPKIIQVILCWWLEDLQLRNPHIKTTYINSNERPPPPALDDWPSESAARFALPCSWLPRNFGMGFQSGTP